MTKDRPEEEFVAGEGEEYLTEEGPSHELCEEVCLLEETIDATVRGMYKSSNPPIHTILIVFSERTFLIQYHYARSFEKKFDLQLSRRTLEIMTTHR